MSSPCVTAMFESDSSCPVAKAFGSGSSTIQMCGFVMPDATDISSTTFTSCCSSGVCASRISRAPVDFSTFLGPVLYEYFAIPAPMAVSRIPNHGKTW